MLPVNSQIVLGAASNQPVSSTSWITIVVLGIIIIIIIIALYRFINVKKPDTDDHQVEDTAKVEKVAKVPEAPKPDKDGITPLAPKEEDVEADEAIVIPVAGTLIPLKDVPDPIYAEKLKGDGFGIEPVDGEIFAPVKGMVKNIAPTRHSITILTPANREVLVHFGKEAATLEGNGFVCNVQEGQEVEIGDLLLKVDLRHVAKKIPSVVITVVFTNLKDNERVVLKDTGEVEAGTRGLVVIEEDVIE